MSDKLFDDLARALATPMPRRRVLRLLGVSLVAISVPGMRPSFGRATSGRSSKCGPDQRVCREFTENEYCCPRPSWQHFCGSKPGQCENTCVGETAFPCTALIAHPQSGINGVCCDRKLHERCQPIGRGPLCCFGSPTKCVPVGNEAACKAKGGAGALFGPSERWKPQCIPCTGTSCGPNTKYAPRHPQRWTCCVKPNTCRKGVCRCPTGQTSCGGKDCCKGSKACKQCVDPGSAIGPFSLTGTVKCCGRDEFCCVDRCCKTGTECCNKKCCPPKTQCARRGVLGTDVCCPERQAFTAPDRTYCCPGSTSAGEAGCCEAGSPDCCARASCPVGSFCVRGTCVK